MSVIVGDVSVDLNSDSWRRLGPCILCCWCCSRRRLLVVVVSVDGPLIFVGDGHNISHAGSGLQCRMRVCVCVWVMVVRRIIFWIRPVQVWRFMLIMALTLLAYFVCYSFIVCHSSAWVVVMLYESPRR